MKLQTKQEVSAQQLKSLLMVSIYSEQTFTSSLNAIGDIVGRLS